MFYSEFFLSTCYVILRMFVLRGYLINQSLLYRGKVSRGFKPTRIYKTRSLHMSSFPHHKLTSFFYCLTLSVINSML